MFEIITNNCVSLFLLFIILYCLFNFTFLEAFECSMPNPPESKMRVNREGKEVIDELGTQQALANWKVKCEIERSRSEENKEKERAKIENAKALAIKKGLKYAGPEAQKRKPEPLDPKTQKLAQRWKGNIEKNQIQKGLPQVQKYKELLEKEKEKTEKGVQELMENADKDIVENMENEDKEMEKEELEKMIGQEWGGGQPKDEAEKMREYWLKQQPKDAEAGLKMIDNARKKNKEESKNIIKNNVEKMKQMADERSDKAQKMADNIVKDAMKKSRENANNQIKKLLGENEKPLMQGLANQEDAPVVGFGEQNNSKNIGEIEKLASKLPCQERCKALYEEKWGEKYIGYKCQDERCKCMKKENGIEIGYIRGECKEFCA